MTASQAKAEARAAAKSRRAAAYAALGAEAASLFADQFFAHVPLKPGTAIAGYAAIGDEADPSGIMALARGHGHPVALPRVATTASPLVFHLWKPGDPLLPGPHGTRHPPEDATLVQPGLLLVPLLAFDGAGHRLGYGGGYYDRTLVALRRHNRGILAVGLAFAAQEVGNLPHEPYDEPLDWIVTERGARAFSGQVQ